MVQKFRMPKYAKIWHSDEMGNNGELLMEAQIGGRRRVGLGLITSGKYIQKKGHLFLTEQGWFHIEDNEELTTLLDDHMGWCEMFD